jgi:hypothetical protein
MREKDTFAPLAGDVEPRGEMKGNVVAGSIAEEKHRRNNRGG